MKNSYTSLWELSGLNIERTPEEEYVHSVNSLVAEGKDISKIYDHKEYMKCMKIMSIHSKDVEEPNPVILIAVLTAAIGVGLFIGIPFIYFI